MKYGNSGYDPKTLKDIPKYAHQVPANQPTKPKDPHPRPTAASIAQLVKKWGR